jgi:hypothetical protein
MAPSAVAPVAARPGQTYFVPGVRIMRLGPLKPGPEAGVQLLEIEPDILGVSVTLVNTGSGQYCITLNNWFDTLPRDRELGTHPSGDGRELTKGGQPLWPRFKYNDFSVLNFGMRLRIDMRYWPDAENTLSRSDQQAQAWVPMISGPISDMRFSFSNTEGATLMVCGEDDLCPLKNKNPGKVDYWAVPEKQIVDDVLKRLPYPLPVELPEREWPKFTESSAKALAEAHFEGQSFLEYLTHFAERMDFEVFVEFRSLDKADSGITFHFEPGGNLSEFVPDLKVVDQYTSVTVVGRDHVQTSPNKIVKTAPPGPTPPEPLDDELHRDELRGDPPLVSGPEWRRRLFGPNPATSINQRGVDDERAAVMADALYRQRARQFLKVECLTIGLPRLRAGKHVEIRGMRPPFDGFYYVEKAVHTYTEDGLQTRLTARRAGAPFPGTYGEI